MEWQTIETAPKSDVLLLYCGRRYVIGRFSMTYYCWVVDDIIYEKINPTHWMPLPAPPS